MEYRVQPVRTGLSENALRTKNRRRRQKSLRRIARRHQQQLGAESLEPRLLLAGDVVISEVMYHPVSEDSRDEWIELYNRGDEPLNLTGYRFSAGVDYTFPDVSVDAGGYLVVAADVERFAELYPSVTNVVGGWTGQLSNSSELIRLRNEIASLVDEFEYGDDGDFAIRRSMTSITDVVNIVGGCNGAQPYAGWVWIAPHDGSGSSLELVNPLFSNDLAHNWGASAPGGTPGTANSIAVTDIAPAVSNVAHSPLIPKSDESVTVTAKIDNDSDGLVTASLYYRVSTIDPPPFTEVPMFDDGMHGDRLAGDGIYGAELPPQEDDAVVEFYVYAVDASGLARTYPAPSDDFGGQDANLLYQVDDADRPDDLILYRVIMTVPERQLYEQFDHRCSDAQRNSTIIATSGSGIEFRYNAGVRFRGSDSRTATPPNTRFNFPANQPLFGNTSMNINGVSPEDQVAGSALWALADEPAADAWPVRMFQNNVDTGGGRYFAQVEVTNGDWATRHFPNDGQGNYYRGRRPNEGPPGGQGATLQYFGEETLPYTSYLKGTNGSEADWSDIIQLSRSLDRNQTPDAVFLETLSQIMNIDQWLKGMALSELTGYNEFGLFIGDASGDDWALYSGVNDPRFVFVPYDMDTMFEGVTGSIYSAENVPPLARLLNAPGIWQRFYQQFLDVADTLTADNVGPHLTQLLGTVESEGTINSWVDFLNRRADYARSVISTELTATASMNDAGGIYTTTAANSGDIRGLAHAAKTHSVLVNGQSASYDARAASWSISGIPLEPGINRVLILSLDQDGNEVARTYLDVYRETSTTNVSGQISSDTIWSVANSPYLVTGEITVAAGVTLTIEPGVDVLFQPDTRMVVNGRLTAIGTESQLIRFTRDPNSGGDWNGIQFQNTMDDNQIHWAILQWGVTDDGMIGLDNSQLDVDSTIFDSTNRRRIRSRDSSLIVRNSTFTPIVDSSNNVSEHIWGGGIPADGHFQLDSNVFGSLTGHNDAVDFDSPRLPNPIPRITNNIFMGGGDDALDMTGDNWIEGNVFRNFIKDALNTDPGESNTISSSSGDYYVIRNVFENVQHVSLIKEGAYMHFLNNTVVNSSSSALYFDLPGQTSGPGRGANVQNSIFENVARAIDMTNPPTEGVTVEYSLLPADEVSVLTTNRSGTAAFIDLVNGDFNLLDGSGGQGTGRNRQDMGALVPGGASISGEPAAVTRSTSATLTVSGPGITDYRYQLSDGVNEGEFSIEEFPISVPIELTGIADGTYTVRVIGKNVLGEWQAIDEATSSQSWTVGSTASRLIINEVLASNDTAFALANGSHPDFIELYNDSDTEISLAGMSITDDPAVPRRFVFPAGTTIGAGEYLVVYADTDDGSAGIFTGFSLRGEGEAVYLFDTVENGGVEMDSIVFGVQATDWSLGRDRNGNWTLNTPTHGAENIAVTPGDPSLLSINEWLVISDVAFNDDYIEIYNPLPIPVAMGGLFITDNSAGWPDRHQIAPYSYVAGDGLALLIADTNVEFGPNHLNFGLSPRMETIALYDADLKQIDMVRYAPQHPDISEGRAPNGSETIVKFTLPNPLVDNPGSLDVNLVPIFPVTDVWKYEQSGADLGTAWQAVDYDDGFWPEGPGLLFVEGEDLGAPKSTPLILGQITYYFRKTFTLDVDLSQLEEMFVTTYVDDGFVMYVNGVEALRVGIPNGEINSQTLANRTVNEATQEGFSISPSLFEIGENTIAVEVHQTNAGSSDIVFGMALDARLRSEQSATNVELLAQNLRITEIMYNPLGGSGFEYIELQNVGADPINLNGVRIADGVDFLFGDTMLPAGEFISVVNNLNNFRTRYGDTIRVAGVFSGSLNNAGERVRLVLPEPHITNVLDFRYDPDWYPDTDGGGFSLVIADPLGPRNAWNEQSGWRSSNFINGSPGGEDVGLEPGILVINEILANTTVASGGQVEILNTIASPIDLSDWYLSDSAEDLAKYQIPAGTTVGAGGFLVFSQADSFGAAFSLNGNGGELFLASSDAVGAFAGFIAAVNYGAVDAETSVGLHRTSDGRVENVEQVDVTIGMANTGPRVGPIVINEVMYRPLVSELGGDEYIELFNTSDSPVDLDSYSFVGAVDFDISNVSVGAGGFVLVVAIDPAEFRTKYGIAESVPIVGPYSGSLDDAGSDIRLVREGVVNGGEVPSILVEHVAYATRTPWPNLPISVNASINRVDETMFANDPINWSLGIVNGTPGAANRNADRTPPSAPTELTGTVLASPTVELTWTAATDTETAVTRYRVYRGGRAIGDTSSTTFVDTAATGPATYDYAVTAINAQGLEGAPSEVASVTIMSVESVTSRFETEVVVRFTEPITADSAENLANYAIDGATVMAAVLGANGRSVTLTTSVLTEAVNYTLSIENIVSQGNGQFAPGFVTNFQFLLGDPGFSVLMRPSPTNVLTLSDADALLSQQPNAQDARGIYATVNFLDDDGHQHDGAFDGDVAFPGNTPGNNDNFVIRARGLITIPAGQAGPWTFGSNVALPDGGVAEINVLPLGSIWSYLDDGSDQGSAWREPGYDDSAWATGPAQLGYGDGDEVTIIDFGGDQANKFPTYYFRTSFDVADASAVNELIGNIVRDDGAAVYLNGIEVYRDNLIDDAAFNDYANGSTGNENGLRAISFDPSLLVNGRNTVAVEVHQSDPDSSDVSFDMQLSVVVEGADLSEDGFRLLVDGTPVLTADGQNTSSDRFGAIELSAGSHEIEFVFFESNGQGEVELFAAPGTFLAFDETDTWRLIGDVANGGLSVVAAPDPPRSVDWLPSGPLGTQVYAFTDQPNVSSTATIYEVELVAGHTLSALAAPQFDGSITLSLIGDGTTIATASASGFEFAAFERLVIPQTGIYRIEITSDISGTATAILELNSQFEDESFVMDVNVNNGSIATAEDLDNSFTEIVTGIQRTSVRGFINGESFFDNEFGTLESGNVITFSFPLTTMPDGRGQVDISAVGDLGLESEFLTIDFEGIHSEDIFVNDGLDDTFVSAIIHLSASEVAAIAADGVVTMTITPSDNVDARDFSSVDAFLQFPESNGDFYKLSLGAGEMLTVTAQGRNLIAVDVDLFNSAGEQFVSGSDVGDTTKLVRNFRAPVAGDYFVRVRSTAFSEYYLVATRGADIAIRDLDSFDVASDISFYNAVVGGLSESGRKLFRFSATAGDTVTISTETQPSGAQNLPNTLDPSVILYDALRQSVASDDNSLDGRNATLDFTISETGTYFVGIESAAGAGEFVLRIVGNTVSAAGFEIVSTLPESGATVLAIPTDIVVNFSESVDPSTLSPSDMTINGRPATAVRLVDDNSVAFEIPGVVAGDVSFEIAAGEIGGLAGGTNPTVSGTFVVDTGAPRIVETTWNGAALPDDRRFATGSLSVSLRFNEPIDQSVLDVFDLQLFNNLDFTSQFAQSFTYDIATNTLSMYFGFVDEGSYGFFIPAIDGGIQDLAGNILDGESNATSPDGTLTGDGTEGGDYFILIQAESGSHRIDSRMQPIMPLGSLVSEFHDSGTVSYFNDIDTYSLELTAGETLEVIVTPIFGGADSLEVVDSAGNVFGSTTVVGPFMQLGPITIESAGKYFVNVIGQTPGNTYDVRVTRNSIRETVDASVSNPQPLDIVRVGQGNMRMSVTGTTKSYTPTTVLYGVQPLTGQIVVIDPVGGMIIDQFAAPDALASGHTNIGLSMADEGKTLLYVNADVDPTSIYRLDPETGNILSIETVATGIYDGLGVVGGDLFLSNDGIDVRRQSDFGPTVDESWTVAAPTGAVGGDDTGRVFGFFADGVIHEFDTHSSGQAFVSSITAPATDIEGLAFDTRTLYASTASGLVYSIDPANATSTGFTVPSGPLFGLAARTTLGRGFTGAGAEVEPNDTTGSAQLIEGFFNLEENPNVHDTSGVNTSTTVPHARILGTGNNTRDVYQFNVNAGDYGVFDIDASSNLDSQLRLYDASGSLLSDNDDTSINNDVGSTTSLDSFFDFVFQEAGTYFIEVGSCCGDGTTVDNGATYELNVSITGKALAATTTVRVIDSGSEWRYLDNGSDPTNPWLHLDFDDSAWAVGASQLGYGDGDETTTVSFGDDPNNKYITTYFRHVFDVADPSVFDALRLGLLRDDGAAVYLNGVEIVRDNLANGAAFNEGAESTVGGANESTFFEFDADAGLLLTGNNILAVEIHQRDNTSSDLGFDLWLEGAGATTQRFVDTGALWSYLDDGSNQSSPWIAISFDDSSWGIGNGQFGYGDGDETTIIDFGGNPDSRYITTYFRREFTVTNAAAVEELRLELLRDDGAAVYLNGVEVVRDNLPVGAGFDTFADSAISGDAEDEFVPFSLPLGLLVDGVNVLAVEVHQNSLTSSDVSFDLTLDIVGAVEAFELPTILDVDYYQLDMAGHIGDHMDIVLSNMVSTNAVDMTLELIAPDGQTVVASGTRELMPGVNAQGISLAILDFVATESSLYTIRVGASGDTEYHLYVAEMSVVDLEPNNTTTDPIRSLNSMLGAHGYISVGGSVAEDDPTGDTTANATTGSALPDIVSLQAEVVSAGLHLVVTYANDFPVDNDWFSYIELDLDQDPSTGEASLQNAIGPVGQRGGRMGVEQRILFSLVNGVDAKLIDTAFNTLATVPMIVGSNRVEMTVPLSVLNDDGNINIGMISGRVADQLTSDAAPDVSYLTVKAAAFEEDPHDLYSVDLLAGEVVTFRTTTPQANGGTHSLDPSLEILDASGTIMSSDANSADDGRNAVLNYTATTAGTYYIRVRSEQYGGVYQLNVAREAANQNGNNVSRVDALARAIFAAPLAKEFDLDDDGFVTYGDLMTMLAGLNSMPGDANLDGRVDGRDFTVWNQHRFRTDTTYSLGDFDANGITDVADFAIWNTHRFTVSASSLGADRHARLARSPLSNAPLSHVPLSSLSLPSNVNVSDANGVMLESDVASPTYEDIQLGVQRGGDKREVSLAGDSWPRAIDKTFADLADSRVDWHAKFVWHAKSVGRQIEVRSELQTNWENQIDVLLSDTTISVRSVASCAIKPSVDNR